MNISLARNAFLLVVLLAIAGAVFRIATAQHRINERRETARSVCIGAGGEWVKVDNDEICRKPDPEVAKKT